MTPRRESEFYKTDLKKYTVSLEPMRETEKLIGELLKKELDNPDSSLSNYKILKHYPTSFGSCHDLLERALRNCYSKEALTIYKNASTTTTLSGFSFNVIHSHGFLPKYPDSILVQNYDSVVLTTNEYFENYKNSTSYGYAQLYERLSKICCFVGNGLIDYEEQKNNKQTFQ